MYDTIFKLFFFVALITCLVFIILFAKRWICYAKSLMSNNFVHEEEQKKLRKRALRLIFIFLGVLFSIIIFFVIISQFVA